MIIDFHTHAFPDALAYKAVGSLAECAKLNPCTDGTIAGLLKEMERCGVDRAVVANIATKPTQQTNINHWAAGLDQEKLIPFGSIHPDAEDWKPELQRIANLGLKGVKLHPDYQGFEVDEPKLYPVYEEISRLGLVLLVHAGYDPVSPNHIHARPEASAKVVRDFPDLKLVLAHMGGCALWDDVEKHLIGRDVYLDLAFTADVLDEGQLWRMINAHGVDRILFGSDLPWHSPEKELQVLDRLDLHHYEKEMIRSGNAMRLLGL